MIDFPLLNQALLAAEVYRQWLPGGHRVGKDYAIGDIDGAPGQSLKIGIENGKYLDHGNHAVSGGDLIALYAQIHHLEMNAAARELAAQYCPEAITGESASKTNGKYPHRTNGAAPETDISQDPLPDYGLPESSRAAQPAPEPPYDAANFTLKGLGPPSQFWLYRTVAQEPAFVVARYETPQGKEIRPWTWRNRRWSLKGYPSPRPLYNLQSLDHSPLTLIVEGEKTADAAAQLFPNHACLTWCGGTNGIRHADWTPLKGRNITLWPDADGAGIAAMTELAAILIRLDCTVGIVQTTGLPEKWDLADPLPADMPDPEQYAREHTTPCNPVTSDEPKPPAKPKLTRLQTSVNPRSAVITQPVTDSLVATYQQWGFKLKQNQRAYCNEYNVTRAIACKAIQIHYDEFSQRIILADSETGDREWSERDTLELTLWLQNELDLADISPKTVAAGVAAYAFQHPQHPVRDWLSVLQWDERPRLAELLPVGFGTTPDEYHAAVGRCFLIGMVARIIHPGCQVDAMPVFEGGQGNGKTSALRIIGGDYFAEVHDSIMSKDFQISLAGKMLCEISELGAFKTADIERIKAIITTTHDRYRAPYAASSTDHPRQGVFSGTTNRDDWNTDETGARRFWPVLCTTIDLQWLKDNREQLFAEAKHRYQHGESWWDVPPTEAERLRAMRQSADPWEDAIHAHLRNHSTVQIPSLMRDVLEMELHQMDVRALQRVGRILKRAGYRKEQRWIAGENIKLWEKRKD